MPPVAACTSDTVSVSTMTPLVHRCGMTRTATIFTCIECGAAHAKWTGQCTTCASWNTIVEETVEPPLQQNHAQPQLAPMARLVDVDAGAGQARRTQIDELDRVLGGGLVAGSVTLLGGEPGIGKSTLMLQLLAEWDGPTLYVSAEESPEQVKSRAERLDCSPSGGWIAAETSLARCNRGDRQGGPRVGRSSTASRRSPTNGRPRRQGRPLRYERVPNS